MIRPGVWHRELVVPLQSIQAELNRLFDEYWRPPGESGASASEGDGQGQGEPTDLDASVWTPTIDLWESTTELVLTVDLPGIDPASIDLSLAGNTLSLRGDKPALVAPPAGSSGKQRIKERSVGSFHRQITLVDEVDFDRVEAQAKDGVLMVRLPKRDSGQPRTISINPAST